MKEKVLYIIWGLMYIICVLLGFVRGAVGIGKFLINATSFIFFLPGILLLWEGYQTGDRKITKRVRIVSIVSLSLTMVVFICNLLSVSGSDAAGNLLYELLGVVSAPMFCAPNRIISLFLWACLLSASFQRKA